MEEEDYDEMEQPIRAVSIKRTLTQDPQESVIRERISVENLSDTSGPSIVETDIVIPHIGKSIFERRMEFEEEAYETYLAAIGKRSPLRSRREKKIMEEEENRKEESEMAAIVRAACRASPVLLSPQERDDESECDYSDQDLQAPLDGEEEAENSEAQGLVPEDDIDNPLAFWEAEHCVKDHKNLKEREEEQFKEETQMINQTIADQNKYVEELKLLKAEYEAKIENIGNPKETLRKPEILKTLEKVAITEEIPAAKELGVPPETILDQEDTAEYSKQPVEVQVLLPPQKHSRSLILSETDIILKKKVSIGEVVTFYPEDRTSSKKYATAKCQLKDNEVLDERGKFLKEKYSKKLIYINETEPKPRKITKPAATTLSLRQSEQSVRKPTAEERAKLRKIYTRKLPPPRVPSAGAPRTPFKEKLSLWSSEEIIHRTSRKTAEARTELRKNCTTEALPPRLTGEECAELKKNNTNKLPPRPPIGSTKSRILERLSLDAVQPVHQTAQRITAEQRTELRKKYTIKLRPPRTRSASVPQNSSRGRISFGPSEESIRKTTVEEHAKLTKKYTRTLPQLQTTCAWPPKTPPVGRCSPEALQRAELRNKYTMKIAPPSPPSEGATKNSKRTSFPLGPLQPVTKSVPKETAEGHAELRRKHRIKLPPPKMPRASIPPICSEVRTTTDPRSVLAELPRRILPAIVTLKRNTKKEYLAQVAKVQENIKDPDELREFLAFLKDAYRNKVKLIGKIKEVKEDVAERFIEELKALGEDTDDPEIKKEMNDFLREELDANIAFLHQAVGAERRRPVIAALRPPSIRELTEEEKSKMKKLNVSENDILKMKKKIQGEVDAIRKITKDNNKTVEIVSVVPRNEQMESLPTAVAENLTKCGLEELAKSPIEKQSADQVYKAMILEKSGVDFKDDPTKVINLIFPSHAPKLNLVGNALESVSEGIITDVIPTAEINALDPVAIEEVALTLSTQLNKPPEEDIATKQMADQNIEILFRQTSPKDEYFECEVLLDSYNVENYFQAKGTALPKWFPGFCTAFPDETSVVMQQRSPSNVLLTAWQKLQPEL